jgi:hypothetical protein
VSDNVEKRFETDIYIHTYMHTYIPMLVSFIIADSVAIFYERPMT